MEEILKKLYGYLVTYGMSFIAAIFIFVIGRWLARFISRVIEKLMIKSNMEKTLASFVKNISYAALLIFVIIAALHKLGVQTTSFQKSGAKSGDTGKIRGHNTNFFLTGMRGKHKTHLWQG